MNKQKKFIFIIIFLLAFVSIYILLMQIKPPVDIEIGNKDIQAPFADIVMPEDFDEATRAVVQKKIDGTKAMYEEKPYFWETWIAIGNLKVLIKDYEGAIMAYRQSIALQSNNILGYRNIAEVYNKNLQDYERAEEYYYLAIENNFGDPEIYISLALLQHNRLDNVEAAEVTYLSGLQNTGNNSEIMTRLIKFYEKIGEQEKYEDAVKLLLELYPDNEGYQREWGN